ncbi:MAG TPA: SDR family NAD(P)-dependent oxidoreductase [Planctomycetota bacterium]|nr:SDR family NAD(P)-dependent oxidoreductase [Planctomycetota bacterium]
MKPERTFITGASSGIGAALAEEAPKRGQQVALFARRGDVLEEVARRADPDLERALIYAGNATDPKSFAQAFQDAASKMGGCDTLVLNAGMGIPTRLEDLSISSLREVFELNFFGAVESAMTALPVLQASGRGHLVILSSMAAWRSGPGASPYNASKAALSSFFEGLRPELEAQGVGLMEVNPGFVRTPMTDRNPFSMPFLMESERAAKVILRAIHRRKRHCSFPLPMTLLLGVARRLPDSWFDFLNRRLYRKLLRTGTHPAQSRSSSRITE